MGVFSETIEVGDPAGQRFERVEAVVDTGASYTQLPAPMLRRLGVASDEKRTFILADGHREQSDIGQTWVRMKGIARMIMVVFAEEGAQPLIGAVTLQEFGLGIDTVGEKLVAVPGYRLARIEDGMTTRTDRQRLIESDLAHQLHPQYHVSDHEDPIIFARGEGALLYDINGREYIDGLSCLWNVAVGHGRAELADTAAQQMRELGFSNSYVGYANEPSIRLAEKLMALVYPNMQAVLFCNSGSEAVEAAIKIARYFWYLQDKPEKVKIVARKEAYHGGTLGATAATGLPPFHKGFGPLAPAFVRAETCYPYRCGHCSGVEDCDLGCADDIENVIVQESPETVAAVIAEPVQGAGGVIVPTPGYWPRLREICDRHDVLLIADEVITGFGRTGRWFALEHWGAQPDIMSVAKAITSAYVPLAGTIYSKRIHDAIMQAPPDKKFMHGYTNAGHPTACAVALRNLQIIEDEGLVERAAELGRRLLDGLQALREHPNVGDVRGLGLIAGVELVADRSTRAPFDPSESVGTRMLREMRNRGLITRVKGDSILFAPPLVIEPLQLDRIISIFEESLLAVSGV